MINVVSTQHSVYTAYAGCSNPGRMQSGDKDSFEAIIEDRQRRGMTAKEYLRTLTGEQLYVIQTAQRMAIDINVDRISEEGAENLFVPLGDNRRYIDLNNDGITEIGEAKAFVFPPPNAPEAVKTAWEKATKNMSFKERMLALSPFMAAQFEANSHQKADGTFEVISAGEPGYINVFGTEADDYVSLLDKIIKKLEYFSKGVFGDEKKNYEFDIRLMKIFKEYILELSKL